MRPFLPALALVLVPACLHAQAVVNQAALDQLAGISPAPVVHAVKPAVRHARRPVYRLVVKRVTPVLVVAPVPAAPKPAAPAPPPSVAAAPAPPPSELTNQQIEQLVAQKEAAQVAKQQQTYTKVASAAPVPLAIVKPPAPLPPPPAPAAPAAVVLSFADGADALPGGAAAALAKICKAAGGGGLVAIDAYAPADESDPSAAMRLSLSRAFAVRDALTGCGVPLSHIIPRADGAAGGDPATARVTLTGGGRQ